MARELFGTRWIKLEVLGTGELLQPDVFGLVEAARILCDEGFQVFPYTTADLGVAERLLGTTVDKLETIGKILKVTRTPKLGAQLDVRFVTEHLRDALPELRQG